MKKSYQAKLKKTNKKRLKNNYRPNVGVSKPIKLSLKNKRRRLKNNYRMSVVSSKTNYQSKNRSYQLKNSFVRA